MVDEAVYIEKITKIKRKQWIEWATIEEESIERDITNAFKDGIEKGRQMGREKFVTTLEREYPAITTWRCWLALKGGKDV
ncbi:hypothetical protein LCGC14_3034200 [marine sediment metagenome]|uniref:Uncharacterized protein n=1 Tax=marine sediment metagenome TaxID=412755 RepID=A0A0F8XES9_9ZZZZ